MKVGLALFLLFWYTILMQASQVFSEGSARYPVLCFGSMAAGNYWTSGKINAWVTETHIPKGALIGVWIAAMHRPATSQMSSSPESLDDFLCRSRKGTALHVRQRDQ